MARRPTETCDMAHARLMALPLDAPDRQRLSERVRATGDKLAAKAAKYLTLATEYAARRAYDKARHAPLPSNATPAWTHYRRAPAGPLAMPAYGWETLAEYVAAFERKNHLHAVTTTTDAESFRAAA